MSKLVAFLVVLAKLRGVNRCSGAVRVVILGAVWICANPVAYSQRVSFERGPIHYLKADVNDAVAKLAARIEAGEASLEFDEQHGYLTSVLDALDVPVSSQVLVFSKTSLQLHRISPRRPRALYFNDEVYVGWCQQGDVLELAANDPKQGAIFYTLNQTREGKPKFIRDQGQCLTCHASSRTQDVPGYLVRSVYADGAGRPVLGSGTFITDHTSPFDQRWGGWYVTGTHGRMRHMGNVISNREGRIEDRDVGANLKTLDQIVRVTPYLSSDSDLVALMVLEHQTQMHNAITLANFETRQALYQNQEMNEILERGEDFISETTERRLDRVAENLVEHLLFCDEFQLTDPVTGTSSFAGDFSQAGPTDRHGRSLRQLDLKSRLFRYPCSYLIHSESFLALPDEVMKRATSKLESVLKGENTDARFSHLSPTLRTEIMEILRDTQPELFR